MRAKVLLFLFLTLKVQGTLSFFHRTVAPLLQSSQTPFSHVNVRKESSSSLSLAFDPTSILSSLIVPNLQTGPFGIFALSTFTGSVVVPLTLYKKGLGTGVAHGIGIAYAGFAMLRFMSSSTSTHSVLMAKACIFSGLRLGSYMLGRHRFFLKLGYFPLIVFSLILFTLLLVRDSLRNYEADPSKNGSISSRIAFSAGLSLFYAFLTTPVLYAMRSSNIQTGAFDLAGTMLAWIGALFETIADLQKLAGSTNSDDKQFSGPTTWTYQICRHPNYFGKLLFWTGLLFGGMSSFGRSIPAWLASTMGLLTVTVAMVKSTEALERRQQDKYGGQPIFEKWREQVKYSLFPGFQ